MPDQTNEPAVDVSALSDGGTYEVPNVGIVVDGKILNEDDAREQLNRVNTDDAPAEPVEAETEPTYSRAAPSAKTATPPADAVPQDAKPQPQEA